jgi:hypothetical protein
MYFKMENILVIKVEKEFENKKTYFMRHIIKKCCLHNHLIIFR